MLVSRRTWRLSTDVVADYEESPSSTPSSPSSCQPTSALSVLPCAWPRRRVGRPPGSRDSRPRQRLTARRIQPETVPDSGMTQADHATGPPSEPYASHGFGTPAGSEGPLAAAPPLSWGAVARMPAPHAPPAVVWTGAAALPVLPAQHTHSRVGGHRLPGRPDFGDGAGRYSAGDGDAEDPLRRSFPFFLVDD